MQRSQSRWSITQTVSLKTMPKAPLQVDPLYGGRQRSGAARRRKANEAKLILFSSSSGTPPISAPDQTCAISTAHYQALSIESLEEVMYRSLCQGERIVGDGWGVA